MSESAHDPEKILLRLEWTVIRRLDGPASPAARPASVPVSVSVSNVVCDGRIIGAALRGPGASPVDLR